MPSLRFPRHINGNVTVLEFDSGWIRVRPGYGTETTAVGYVVIGEEGRKLAIYHAWGEI